MTIEPHYKLVPRTCGCGISFKVLPGSPQYTCGRTHCSFVNLSPDEKVAKAKQQFIDVRPNPVPKSPLATLVALKDFQLGTWGDCVAAARMCVMRIGDMRMVIAELSLRACEIKWGGGDQWTKFANRNTLKDFALEIRINPKTLYEWVAAKRNVVDKLPLELAEEAMKPDKYARLTEARRLTKRGDSPEKVLKTFNDVKNMSKYQERVRSVAKYVQGAASLMNNHVVRDESRLEDLERLYGAAVDIQVNLEDYLVTRRLKEGK